jgi:hypothetical protein
VNRNIFHQRGFFYGAIHAVTPYIVVDALSIVGGRERIM